MRKMVARVANVLDEFIAEELSVSEGFIDITGNDERQEELGIFPVNSYEI